MFSIKKASAEERELLPGQYRLLPAYMIHEHGEITGYCVFKIIEDGVIICGLFASEAPIGDTALRAVLASVEDYTDKFYFSKDFSGWELLLTPKEKLQNGGSINKFLHSCG